MRIQWNWLDWIGVGCSPARKGKEGWFCVGMEKSAELPAPLHQANAVQSMTHQRQRGLRIQFFAHLICAGITNRNTTHLINHPFLGTQESNAAAKWRLLCCWLVSLRRGIARAVSTSWLHDVHSARRRHQKQFIWISKRFAQTLFALNEILIINSGDALYPTRTKGRPNEFSELEVGRWWGWRGSSQTHEHQNRETFWKCASGHHNS